MDRDGTDVFQERWDQYMEDTTKENDMKKPLNQVNAEDLVAGQVIIDPEGNEARVIRLQRIGHDRGRLTTDLGAAIVWLDQEFPVLP